VGGGLNRRTDLTDRQKRQLCSGMRLETHSRASRRHGGTPVVALESTTSIFMTCDASSPAGCWSRRQTSTTCGTFSVTPTSRPRHATCGARRCDWRRHWSGWTRQPRPSLTPMTRRTMRRCVDSVLNLLPPAVGSASTGQRCRKTVMNSRRSRLSLECQRCPDPQK